MYLSLLINRHPNTHSSVLNNLNINTLTYPRAIAAYDEMTQFNLIRVSKDAYFNPDTGRDELTKVLATDKPLQIMEGLDENPLMSDRDLIVADFEIQFFNKRLVYNRANKPPSV